MFAFWEREDVGLLFPEILFIFSVLRAMPFPEQFRSFVLHTVATTAVLIK